MTSRDIGQTIIDTDIRLFDGHAADMRAFGMRLSDKRDRKNLDVVTPADLPVPASGNRVHYDSEVKGFGLRVTAAGVRSFVINYTVRSNGRERRFTIGRYPVWSVAAAREEAKALRTRVDRGEDPLAELEVAWNAPTVADLCKRFADEHLPKKRPSTQVSYQGIIDRDIIPALRHLKVADVSFEDIDGLHRKITGRGAAYRANRVAAVLSKMFSLAVRWKWRPDNPVRGIERNQEIKRQRYLSGAELASLATALEGLEDVQAASIVRLLLLTGARSGEVRAMRWRDIDLAVGVWTKPGSTTKQRTDHRVPLSSPARQVLTDLRAAADEEADFVFPSGIGFRGDIKDQWALICRKAGMVETRKGADGKTGIYTTARVHDLRHTFASVLVSSGLSLPIIGALLGHTQPVTTARYAHLFDDPLRAATEQAGAIVMGRPSAEIVPMQKVAK